MTEHKDIWVFSEKTPLQAELIACAKSMAANTGGSVAAVILGPRQAVEQAFEMGAERIIWLGELPAGRIVEDGVPTLVSAVQNSQPYGILIGATTRGRAVAGRLSARLGSAALTDVLEFQFTDGLLQAKHMVFGGGAVRIDRPNIGPIVATFGPGIYTPLPPRPGASGEIETVPWVEPSWQAVVVEHHKRESSSVNLTAAKKVVCPGRGLKQQEDLALIDELAQTLGAEVACTRPLAEGLNWMPRERYIGISGAMVKPDLYLGIGVSGQAQHTIGMSESRVVAAINKDRSAPLMTQADYAIEGDLYAVVPALIRVLKARKGK